jgi:hypothetical protein
MKIIIGNEPLLVAVFKEVKHIFEAAMVKQNL